MYKCRNGIIKRCHTTLSPSRSSNRVQVMNMGLKHLIYSRPHSFSRLHSYIGSSLSYRGYYQATDLIPVQNRSQSYSPSPCSARKHHLLPSSLSKLRLMLSIFEKENFRVYTTSKNYKSNHAKDSRYSTFLTHLTSLLTSLGLTYLTYKIVTHIMEQSNLLPVANCLSFQEPNLAQTEKVESNQGRDKSSNTSLEKSNQQKIGGAGNEFSKIPLQAAIATAQKLCQRRKEEVGSPGIVVCVSVDGKQIYAEGFGYADVENQVPMKPSSLLRIASISKAITATIVAKAEENGKIDIEKVVQHYVPSFPQKEFLGEKVEITVKQLLNHSSGIRHYKPKDDPVYAFDQPILELVGVLKDASLLPFYKTITCQTKKTPEDIKEEKIDKNKNEKAGSKPLADEYYLAKHYSTTTESLALFADDPLVARPGTKYLYTTYAYTLLAAVVESALKKPFTTIVTQTLKQMGLKTTYLDLNDPILYNRARYYVKDAKGNIANVPYVDNSYKWAGGGLLSTAEDVVKFGNILLYSAQHQDGDAGPPGFLKSSSIWKFWSPQGIKGASLTYGLGFSIRPANELYGMCDQTNFGVGHTGAAMGVSSALFILPRRSLIQTTNDVKKNNTEDLPNKLNKGKTTLHSVKEKQNSGADSTSSLCKTVSASINKNEESTVSISEKNPHDQTNQTVTTGQLPQGVVVCVMLNMISVSARDVAEEIARTFENVDLIL